jgi:cell division protein FtsZ
VLINITGSSALGLHDVNEACSIIREATQCEDVQINFGVTLNESMGDEVKVTVIATGFDAATKGLLNSRGEQLSAAARPAAAPSIPYRPFAPREIAAQHQEPPAPQPQQPQQQPQQQQQVGAEGEIYDPPFFRKGGFTRTDGSGGFGPMASNDFGNDLDIPTVIRNLSD